MVLLLFIFFISMMMPVNDTAPIELRLSELRWEQRVLLIFAGDTGDESYQEQLRILREAESGLQDRKLVRITFAPGTPARFEGQPITEESQRAIRQAFASKNEGFSFVLLGLDGGEKLRSRQPVSTKELFARIDRMPMRARELQDRKQNP